MTRFAPVYRALGMIIMLFGLTMLAPLILSYATNDGAQAVYDESFGLTMLSGAFLWYRYRNCKRELTIRDGFLMVVLVWSVLPAFAAIPLMLQLGISHTDAYFETVSGLTTTGSTVLSNIDQLPMSINLWRHQLVWVGGMGLIVLAIAVLPLLGIGGRQMFKAETPGPMKDAKMTPRIAETAKGLWLVYLGVTVACCLSFRLAGMNWFDAVCHTFSTMGLGGFSTHDASFGYFDSPAIEAVAIVFMLIAGMNFGTLFLAVSGRSLRPYLQDPEAGWFIGVTLVSIFVVAVYIWKDGIYADLDTAMRHAAFNLVSIATTTGFASVDFALWPIFAPLWMLFLSSFATSAGSTGGGIKMMRALLLYKQVYRELLRAMHPSAVYNIRIGGQVASQPILFAVLAFAFMYMVSIVSLTLVLAFTGLDIVTAFTAIVASVNNTGPGLGLVGPSTTYEVLEDFQTWVCIFAMLLGRLEIFTLLVVLTPAFWRK
ncbi:TrkH family potassium uptake protein [Dechloromonas sp. TW-R-39-2]|uniref:TrkH family potassium uptake protein n=1 Tax=Dechloromonas TaxID=73029 RepID=UPI00193CE910|nr:MULTISPECIES: potassium transporter TrkG [Dechloromonas]QRM18241.1 TrkH family potassium uptake protein [Dechloromonas sp. TW-R-39-2]UCV11692.1 TrkH family potassium uptake protein [Dechloromonas denitrificans]